MNHELTPEAQSELSPALQELENMPLNFDDMEFYRRATETDNQQESEDTFLRSARLMIAALRGEDAWSRVGNLFGPMGNILDRDCMRNSAKREVFAQALEELKARSPFFKKKEEEKGLES